MPKIKIDSKKLAEKIEELGLDIGFGCVDSSMCVGTIRGNPVIIRVVDKEYDDDRSLQAIAKHPKNVCITVGGE